MDQRTKDALDVLNAETSKTPAVENVVQILTDCFGTACTDITKHIVKEFDERYDRTLSEILSRNAPQSEIIAYIKRVRPVWDVIIKFPHETVTNEMGNHVDIYDFFVRASLFENGALHSTSAIKATFTENQLYSGYVHSHCPGLIKTEEGIQSWGNMCFGSGPIGDTTRRLRIQGCDPSNWIAFASELRQWVRTESTAGGPYFRLDSIRGRYTEILMSKEGVMTIKVRWLPLVKSYIRAKRLRVGFIGGKFCLGTTFTEWLVDFSEYATQWAQIYRWNIPLCDTLIINNKICEDRGLSDSERRAMQSIIGKKVLDFKGKPVLLKVVEGAKVEHRRLVSYQQALHIIKSILNALNYNYGGTDNQENSIEAVQWE